MLRPISKKAWRWKKIKSLKDRFYDKIEKKDNGCWEWMGSKNANGRYGSVWDYEENKCITASRASWKLHNGQITNGLYVLHKCDNSLCVNPDHLFLGTQKENIQDMVNKGRCNFFGGYGTGRKGRLSYDDVVYIRDKGLYSQDGFQNVRNRIVLSLKYNMCERHIRDIINGASYRDVPMNPKQRSRYALDNKI